MSTKNTKAFKNKSNQGRESRPLKKQTMEIEYSRVRGEYAYTFTPSERAIVRLGFKREISRLRKQVIKWKAHPDNEGQLTFLEKIRQAERSIDLYMQYVEELK